MRLRPVFRPGPHWGGAYSSPQTPSRLTGAASGQAREAEEMGRDREVEKGKGTGRGGERSPTSFFQFNHCLYSSLTRYPRTTLVTVPSPLTGKNSALNKKREIFGDNDNSQNFVPRYTAGVKPSSGVATAPLRTGQRNGETTSATGSLGSVVGHPLLPLVRPPARSQRPSAERIVTRSRLTAPKRAAS